MPAPSTAPHHVVVLGPALDAVSGVSTHLRLLFGSALAGEFALIHFQVGSEGRREAAPLRLLRLVASPFALAARLLATDAAAVHINTSLNARAYWRDLAYLGVAKLCGTSVIYQVHGGALPAEFAAGNSLLARWLRMTLALPDVVVVLTQAELAAYRAFVPEQAVALLPNAIDLSPYAGLQRPPADAAAPLRLVYVGRLVRDKGMHDALHGLALARAQGCTATLVIAGSGPDEAPLRALAHRLELDAAVVFAGPVFGDEKLALYAQADAVLFPTYVKEGLPYALLEGMAAGLPAITTRAGGIPDAAVAGVHALFVEARDAPAIAAAIVRLAGNRPLLAKMGEACRRRVAHSYTLDRLAGDFARLYAEVCARRRPRLLGRL